MKSIQILVDEHALFGMNHQEIKAHLFSMHSIARDTKIPPISKRAIKSRGKFLRTRKYPDWAEGEIISDNSEPQANEEISEKKDKTNPVYACETSFNQESGLHRFEAEMMEEYGFKPEIKMYERDLDEVEKSIVNVYESNHPTSLDRWFFTRMTEFYNSVSEYELGQIIEYFDLNSPSRYTIFEAHIKEISKEYRENIFESFLSMKGKYGKNGITNLDMMFYSHWFVSNDTKNIQIPFGDCEEFFSSKKAHKETKWKKVALEKPLFIDVKNNKTGERYISGVSSIPLKDGTIRFSAFIEWKNIGLQGIVQWHDEDMSEEALFVQINGDSIVDRDETIKEYQEAAAMALRLYKSVLNSESYDALIHKGKITKITSGEIHNEKNKNKKKKKTKSIFNFEKKEISYQYKENKENRRSSWKLDSVIGVSGHFRMQPYGPENRKIKIIWIDPYTKGKGEIETKLDKHLISMI